MLPNKNNKGIFLDKLDSKKTIKSSIFSLFILLLAVVFWYFLKELFIWQEGSTMHNLIYASISFSMLIIFSLVHLLLIDSRKIILISSLLISVSFLPFFLRQNGTWAGRAAIAGYLISVFILLVGYNSANRNLISERKNSIKFYPQRTIMRAVPTFMIAFAILLSVTFYFHFPFMNEDKNIEIKEEHLKKISEPFGDMINRYLPIYYLDITTDEFIILNLFLNLPFLQGEEEIELPAGIREIPPEIKNYLTDKGIDNLEEIDYMKFLREDKQFRNLFIEEIKKIADEADSYLLSKYRSNISNNWGIEVSGDETMGVVYTRLINNKINQVPEGIKNLFLIMVAASFFGLLQVAFMALGFIYSFFSWLVLIILYKARFYNLKKIEIEKEEIEL